MKNWLSILLYLIIPICSFGQWEVAMDAYNNEKFDTALAQFKDLSIASPSPELDYNIANCYYKLEKYGYAIAYFEKALKSQPFDEDIQHNLRFANQYKSDKVDYIPPFNLAYTIKFISKYLPGSVLTLLMIIFGASALVLYLLRTMGLLTDKWVPKWIWLNIVFSISIWLIAELILPIKENFTEGVIVTEYANVYLTPQEGANTSFVLHEGTKAYILEYSFDETYVKIRVNKEMVGWVKKEKILNI